MVYRDTPLSWKVALLDTPLDHVTLLQEQLNTSVDTDELFVMSVLWAFYYRHSPTNLMSDLFPSAWNTKRNRTMPAHLVALPLTALEQDSGLQHMRLCIENIDGANGPRGSARARARQLIKAAHARKAHIIDCGLEQYALQSLDLPTNG